MRIGLSADFATRDGSADKDATIKNGYVDAEFVNSRPGAVDLGAAGSGNTQGLGEIGDSGAAVVGDSLRVFTVSGGVISVDATASLSPHDAGLLVTMQESGKTQTTELLLKTSAQGWIYTP